MMLHYTLSHIQFMPVLSVHELSHALRVATADLKLVYPTESDKRKKERIKDIPVYLDWYPVDQIRLQAV